MSLTIPNLTVSPTPFASYKVMSHTMEITLLLNALRPVNVLCRVCLYKSTWHQGTCGWLQRSSQSAVTCQNGRAKLTVLSAYHTPGLTRIGAVRTVHPTFISPVSRRDTEVGSHAETMGQDHGNRTDPACLQPSAEIECQKTQDYIFGTAIDCARITLFQSMLLLTAYIIK